MADILLLDNHEKTRRLYSVNLEVYTASNVIECDNIETAVDYLENFTPQIIIVRSKIDQRNADESLYKVLKQKEENPLFIVLGESKINYSEVTTFAEPIELKELIQTCADKLGITAKDMAGSEVGEYYPIPLYLILEGFQLVCPIYKRNQKGEFKEFLKKDHHIYKEVLVMLKDDGVEEIYVKALDRLKFVSSLTVQTTEFLRNDNITIEEKLAVVEQGHQMTRNMAKKMMIDNETIQLAEASIDIMVSIVDNISSLKSLLEITLENHMSFIYRHCLLTSYIGSHIINNMEWGSRDQQVKVAFVSFFHDIALTEEKLVKIHDEEELDNSILSDLDKNRVRNHALNSAKFLSKYYNSIPFGADTIVKQHHGSRNGIGLNNLSQNISPLAIVFIVAEEWALLALKNEDLEHKMDRTAIVNHLRTKYNLPAFKKVLAVLDQLAF